MKHSSTIRLAAIQVGGSAHMQSGMDPDDLSNKIGLWGNLE